MMSKHRNRSRPKAMPTAAPQTQPGNKRAILIAAIGLGVILASLLSLWLLNQRADGSATVAALQATAALTSPNTPVAALTSALTANPTALPTKHINALNQLPAGRAERVEVAYFHRTQRCAGCQEADRLIRKTLDTYFSEQVASGAIHLAVTDVQKPENAALTRKYAATGSSLYFGIAKDGVEYLCPIGDVWMVLNNEAKFLPLLRDRINAALGES